MGGKLRGKEQEKEKDVEERGLRSYRKFRRQK
jgi:hypothetical protein